MATSTQNPTTAGVIPVPTMSTQGLVSDSANKFDMLMAHLFAADANQTYLYQGRVSSLASFVERGGGDRVRIEESIRQGFYDYLNRYYQNVSVEAEVTEIDNSSMRLDFKLTIFIRENAGTINRGMLVRTAQKKLQEIIQLNNYG